MLAFLPTPDPMPQPAPASGRWRGVLLVSTALGAFATTQPWIQVQFARLFGPLQGPPGWQSSAGFTCLCTYLLVATMTLAETSAKVTHQAVRPASLLLVAVSTVALALECWEGPGHLRGVTACWTYAFWLLAGCVPALLMACTLRCAELPSRSARDGL